MENDYKKCSYNVVVSMNHHNDKVVSANLYVYKNVALEHIDKGDTGKAWFRTEDNSLLLLPLWRIISIEPAESSVKNVGRHKILSNAQAERLRELHKQGMSLRKIAKELGVKSPSTISNYLE